MSRSTYKGLDASAAPYSQGVACNIHSVAFAETSNSVKCLPLDMLGSERAPARFGGHSGIVSALQFNPYSPNRLVSASQDSTVKVWNVEPTYDITISEPLLSLSDFDGPINDIDFHPSCGNLLAVGSKKSYTIADVETGQTCFKSPIDDNSSDVWSIAWTSSGTQIAALTKSKELVIFDPRTNPDLASVSTKFRLRPHMVVPLHEHYMLTAAQNKYRQPLIQIRDLRNPSETLIEKTTGFQSGFTLAHFDADTRILCVTARGGSSMNFFDLNTSMTNLDQASLDRAVCQTQFQGFACLPKPSLDLDSNEIIRVMKLAKDNIEPISLKVPRRVEKFDPDLFPPSRSETASLTVDEWSGGKDAAPELKNLAPEVGAFSAKPVLIDQKRVAPVKQRPQAEKRHNPFEKKVEEKQEYVHVLSDSRKKMDVAMQQSTFFHTSGSEPRSLNAYYTHLKPQAKSKSLALCDNVEVNKKFAAFPWTTVGGSGLFIQDLSNFGRCKDNVPLIRGHTEQISSFSLSKLKYNLVATGGLGGLINIWEFGENGVEQDMNEADVTFQNEGKVRKLRFHSSVNGILAAALEDFNGHELAIFNVDNDANECSIDAHPAMIWDIAWCTANPALLATTCKDKNTRVIDPRANRVVEAWEPPEGQRDTRVLWTGSDDRLITCGFGVRSSRSVSLWDLRNTAKPIGTKELSVSNSNLLPVYDEDTRLLFVNAVGERQFHILLMEDTKITTLAGWKTEPQHHTLGIAMQEKSMCDVTNVEVAKVVRLTQNALLPITFRVPRKRKEFFQDDIFPPTRATESLMEGSEWFDGKNVKPRYVALQPEGMDKLSNAPEEEMTERQKRHIETLAEQKKQQEGHGYLSHDQAIDKWSKMAMKAPSRNRWDAAPQGAQDDVDDDEWGDDSD